MIMLETCSSKFEAWTSNKFKLACWGCFVKLWTWCVSVASDVKWICRMNNRFKSQWLASCPCASRFESLTAPTFLLCFLCPIRHQQATTRCTTQLEMRMLVSRWGHFLKSPAVRWGQWKRVPGHLHSISSAYRLYCLALNFGPWQGLCQSPVLVSGVGHLHVNCNDDCNEQILDCSEKTLECYVLLVYTHAGEAITHCQAPNPQLSLTEHKGMTFHAINPPKWTQHKSEV